VFAKLLYAIEFEMAATPVDFYFRRTGGLLFDIDSVHNWKGNVSRYMADRFTWSKSQKEKFVHELEAEMEAATGKKQITTNVSSY
jgi:glycerol-3-phosphate dehydrogenase